MKNIKTQAVHRALCAIVIVIGNAGLCRAQSTSDLAKIWNDPVFKKQFIASYGFNAEIEPRVTAEEVAILEKVRALMADDDMPKAEVLLAKHIKSDDKASAIFNFTLAGIHFQQDKMNEALESYRIAITKFPSFRRAFRNLGLICVRNGNFPEAITAFTRMIELGGGDAYSYGLLGFAYASKQDYQAAEAAYRNALLLQPENSEWRLGLTRCVFRQEKFEDAAAMLDGLIERYPDNADFWILQAHTFIGMKNPMRAAENLEAVDRLGKATVDSMNTLGDIYLTENLTDLAARAYIRAIDVDPAQPVSRALRAAEALAARGASNQAQQIARHIQQVAGSNINEQDKRKLLKLEARLSMAQGVEAGPETIAVLEEIIKLDPLDGEALMLLGQHYARHNEPDRAMFYYERAASLDAFAVNACIRHAQVLVGLNRYAEAVPLLRRAQDVKPREDIARYLEQVERQARARR
jgi:tetratricopeptide (TPR) repeat protein